MQRRFPFSQCSSSAKAACRKEKVTDLEEYEVGAEIAMCEREHSCVLLRVL